MCRLRSRTPSFGCTIGSRHDTGPARTPGTTRWYGDSSVSNVPPRARGSRPTVTVRHYDLVAQALAKIERGHGRDLADVEAMLDRGLISGAEVRAMYARVELELYRFPAIDPPSFRRAVDAVFPP
jgi:hypothetical protein